MKFFKSVQCPDCKERFKPDKGVDWSDQVKCPSCGRVFQLGDNNQPLGTTVGVQGVKLNPTAFGYDDKGRLVGVDKNGKRIDPAETRYDLNTDPLGWKTAGKKVREKDRMGRKYGE